MRKRRNLLVILAGGMRADAFGGSGTWGMATPHLDAIAEYGVALSAVAASPLPGPAMVSLLTGMHPRQHGVLDEPMPQGVPGGWLAALTQAGYRAMGVGRVGPVGAMLDRSCIVNDATDRTAMCEYLRHMDGRGLLLRALAQRQQRRRFGPCDMNAAGLTAPTDDVDGFISQQATEMMGHLPADDPWVMIVSFTGPGNDLPAPPLYLSGVPALRNGFSPADMRTIDHYAELTLPRSLLQKLTPAKLNEIRRHYLARVLMIDHAVGAMRQSLERSGHADSTWIVFAGDRGKLLGERGVISERSLLGPAVATPLWLLPPEGVIDSSAGSDPALTSHELVSTVDLAPTLCAIAGVDPPRNTSGASLLPALRGEVVGRPAVISEYGGRLMLETMQHRIIFDIESEQPRALFDVLDDPDERRDLVDTPHGLALVDMLRWQLAGCLMRLRPHPAPGLAGVNA